MQIPKSQPRSSQELGSSLVEQSHWSCEGCGFKSHLSPYAKVYDDQGGGKESM